MVFEITLVLFEITLFAFVVIDDTLNHRDCSSKANTREAADTDVYKNCANHDCFHSLSPPLVKKIIIVISCKVRFSRSLTTKRLTITNLLQIVKTAGDALITRAVESIEADAGTTVDSRVTADEIVEATRDFILKELSKNLKGYDLEEFVADLLRAMGYRTTVSAHGGDSGIDITAYKDELPPRILVQVKSQDSDIKEATIQSLKGAMREGDYGLFVTLSNYTKNAQKYLDSTPIIRGINGTELVDLILKYYHDLSDKYKKMIPLKMVYIPVAKDEQA